MRKGSRNYSAFCGFQGSHFPLPLPQQAEHLCLCFLSLFRPMVKSFNNWIFFPFLIVITLNTIPFLALKIWKQVQCFSDFKGRILLILLWEVQPLEALNSVGSSLELSLSVPLIFLLPSLHPFSSPFFYLLGAFLGCVFVSSWPNSTSLGELALLMLISLSHKCKSLHPCKMLELAA